jgi:hypothetical protein
VAAAQHLRDSASCVDDRSAHLRQLSFILAGKTLGLDLDGPQNDKGLYALVSLQPQMAIRNEDVIAWSSFRGKLGSQAREGFMSQVSPDGKYVVTTIKPPGSGNQHFYYSSNFKEYRFLRYFILRAESWYGTTRHWRGAAPAGRRR